MSWLVPVGTPGGICSGLADVPDGSGVVRLGDRVMCLDPVLYRVWRAAAAAPQEPELIAWASGAGIEDAKDAIGELDDAGLLVHENSDTESRVGRLALRLTGECFGNGDQRSTKFSVIGQNGVCLSVSICFFEVLLRADGVSPLSELCQALDGARPELERRPCLEMFTEGLPALVRNAVVRLDAAGR